MFAAVSCLWIALIASSVPPEAFQAPPVHNLRFEENWWGQPAGPTSLKYIPIGDSGAYLTLGGQVRVRSEFWDSFGFLDAPSREDAFALLRVRLHGDLYLGSRVRIFVEGKSALATDRDLPGGRRVLDADSLALQNALLDFRTTFSDDASLTLRVGRQELQFGRQRLVSPLNWSNTRPRSFDALRAIIKRGAWRVDGFWGQHVKVRQYDFNRPDQGTQFFGIYAARKGGGLDADFYWLGLQRDRTTLGSVTGSEIRHTVGVRTAGKLAGPVRFDLETALQFGDQADRDLLAQMVAAEVTASWAARLEPVLRLGFDYASGDDDPRDGDLHTFDPLFPLGHAYFGSIDAVGRQNIIDLSGGFALRPAPGFTTRIDLHRFWRAREEDALYNAGGGVIRPGVPDTSRDIGLEFDLTLSYSFPQRWLSGAWVASAGFSHLTAGDFLTQTGPGDDIAFGYLSLQYTF